MNSLTRPLREVDLSGLLAHPVLGRVVAEIIRIHGDAPAPELVDRVRGFLTRLNVSNTYWPGDEEIRAALIDEPAYRRFKVGRLKALS